MRRFLPFERVSIATALPPRIVAERLLRAVADAPWGGESGTELPLLGWVEGNDFLLRRVQYELFRSSERRRVNGFQPEFRGRIIGSSDGCRLEGTMMLQPAAMLTFVGWTVGLVWGTASFVYEALRTGVWPWNNILVATAMLDAITIFWQISLTRELRMTRDILDRLFAGS